MVRRLQALFAALMLVAVMLPAYAAPAVVSAHNSCADTQIYIYEGYNLTGDGAVVCGNINDLNTAGHGPAGNCDDHLFGDNSWDDCISSWKVIKNVHNYCIGIWGTPASVLVPLLEGGRRAAGYWSNMDGGENNTASAITWSTSGTGVCAVND